MAGDVGRAYLQPVSGAPVLNGQGLLGCLTNLALPAQLILQLLHLLLCIQKLLAHLRSNNCDCSKRTDENNSLVPLFIAMQHLCSNTTSLSCILGKHISR